jgi:peptide-methionine (R)-S-oxide reductase
MIQKNQNRRQLIGSLVATTAAAPMILSGSAHAEAHSSEDFAFEVVRTEAEWRDQLTELEFTILRGGGTEQRKSSPLWDETREGLYYCRGCELKLFDAYWKTVRELGWVFFRQSEPYAIVTAIDRIPYPDLLAGADTTMTPELTAEQIRELDTLAGVEAQCRRCGSHLGHIIPNNGIVLYCINGAALSFQPIET